ncbi:HTTM domain-containing protein [Halosolutus gelatinilyticus]|uniref:HTTM domain-containing protein n=1 Tax=Halosolutus gelatinilyticus TaxID=2931975 RepID=UPI001FF6D4C0|nr:HTTM domain-containing protein [Halosolutus gelatinilyticus]
MALDRQRLANARNRLADGADRTANGIRRRFEIDRRALAAFRIAVGALLLADLLRRARKLEDFYTDSGVLPREALYSDYSPLYSNTFHTLSGETWAQALLFCVAGAFALALLVGYRTRIATIASWLLLVSLHLRNPMAINGGDVLLRMLLFWAIFLPLDSRWAVDARRVDRSQLSPTVASVGTMAVLLQVLLMYVTNAIHKFQSEKWTGGEAVAYIFQADHFTYLLGNHLADQILLLRAFTYAWMGLILLSPLLVLLTGRGRAAIATVFAGMHLGMLVTLRIDLFPLIVIAGLVLFYPPRVWDGVSAIATRIGIADPLQRLLARFQATAPVLAVPRPTEIGGVRSHVPSLSVVTARGRVLFATVIPWLLLVLVVLSNAEAVGYTEVPEPGAAALDTLQADQSWRMFAPNPISTAQWLVVPGELEDGSEVDVLHESDVDWDRPPNVDATYDTARERKYISNMRFAGNRKHRSYFANYLCERWNRSHETDVERLTVYGLSDRSGPYEDEPDVVEVKLIEYDCSGEFVQRTYS